MKNVGSSASSCIRWWACVFCFFGGLAPFSALAENLLSDVTYTGVIKGSISASTVQALDGTNADGSNDLKSRMAQVNVTHNVTNNSGADSWFYVTSEILEDTIPDFYEGDLGDGSLNVLNGATLSISKTVTIPYVYSGVLNPGNWPSPPDGNRSQSFTVRFFLKDSTQTLIDQVDTTVTQTFSGCTFAYGTTRNSGSISASLVIDWVSDATHGNPLGEDIDYNHDYRNTTGGPIDVTLGYYDVALGQDVVLESFAVGDGEQSQSGTVIAPVGSILKVLGAGIAPEQDIAGSSDYTVVLGSPDWNGTFLWGVPRTVIVGGTYRVLFGVSGDFTLTASGRVLATHTVTIAPLVQVPSSSYQIYGGEVLAIHPGGFEIDRMKWHSIGAGGSRTETGSPGFDSDNLVFDFAIIGIADPDSASVVGTTSQNETEVIRVDPDGHLRGHTIITSVIDDGAGTVYETTLDTGTGSQVTGADGGAVTAENADGLIVAQLSEQIGVLNEINERGKGEGEEKSGQKEGAEGGTEYLEGLTGQGLLDTAAGSLPGEMELGGVSSLPAKNAGDWVIAWGNVSMDLDPANNVTIAVAASWWKRILVVMISVTFLWWLLEDIRKTFRDLLHTPQGALLKIDILGITGSAFFIPVAVAAVLFLFAGFPAILIAKAGIVGGEFGQWSGRLVAALGDGGEIGSKAYHLLDFCFPLDSILATIASAFAYILARTALFSVYAVGVKVFIRN